MGDYLRSICWRQEWRPTSRYTVAAWLVFYVVFLIYAFSKHGDFLFIDLANLVVHEGGHLLFGWFGPTLGLWGGTVLQWLVPLLLTAYFFSQRQASAFAFCSFFFFENWLYTATYMADARAMLLPLVTAGHISCGVEPILEEERAESKASLSLAEEICGQEQRHPPYQTVPPSPRVGPNQPNRECPPCAPGWRDRGKRRAC